MHEKTRGELHMTDRLDALIIGGGFSGCYQLYRLRQKGFNVKLYDAGHALGGVWYWNCYPGARVDSDVPNYEFSMEELWRDWNWTERFPGWQELRAYFEYVDEKLNLAQDVRFDSRVVSAGFDEDAGDWHICCEDGHEVRAKILVSCLGFASKAYIPDIKGLDDFSGPCYHTARWPQAGVDFTAKRVGVLGTGASGVQVVQEAAGVANRLTVFQRTPNIALPMQQRAYDADGYGSWKREFHDIFRKRDASGGGLWDISPENRSARSVPDAERLARFESCWQRGGFHFWSGTYNDILSDLDSNRMAYDFWREKTWQRIEDPVIAERLAPRTPLHPFGAKRPSLEQCYFEAFNRDDVELIDVRTTPISGIVETGVKLGTRQVDLDVLVLATGFDASSGGLMQIDLRGRQEMSLKKEWQDGVRTWLGIGIPGFPNLVMLYGPQSPTAFWNGPTSAEVQGDWVIRMLEWMREKGHDRVEATVSAAESWNTHMETLAAATLLPQAESWYMGANIPGKPRQLLSHSGVQSYMRHCEESAANDYAGFSFS